MSTINPEFTQRIKDANNIHDIISGYISLKRAGINYKGCCPFHDEKTSSFIVSPSKSIYKCFGCGAGGDVIKFVQEYEKVTFPEALKILAQKANIEMPDMDMTDDERKRMLERESLLAVNAEVWTTYRNNLMNNTTAMAYVQKRGYSQEIINSFGVGFAETNNQLTTTLTAAHKTAARKLSLLKSGVGGEYDQFRNRVMFAFQDISGNVLGFTGRHIDWQKSDNFPKFLNSDESNLFHKEKVVFGIFQAKKSIVQMDKAYQVEGQGDVLAMHMHKMTNTVAGSGTAFSIHQAKQIMRFTRNITLMYDGDKAGAKATLAVLPIYLSLGANVRIITLPEGKDPDTFIPTLELEKIGMRLLDMEQDVVSYMYQLRKEDLKDVYKKNEALVELGALLALIEDDGIRNSFIKNACILYAVAAKDFAPKCKATKEAPKTDTWNHGFYGLAEAKLLLKKGVVSTLTFNEKAFIENYESKPYILAKGNITAHNLQEFHSLIKKCRVEEKNSSIQIDDEGHEPANLCILKEMYKHGIEIEIERDTDEEDTANVITGFVDYYVSKYGLLIAIVNCTETQKAAYIKNCSEVIACADVTVRTVSMKAWAKTLELSQTDLKAIVQPILNLKKDKATLENQRLNTESDLLEFDPEKVPSYVAEDKNMSAVYQRDRFYPLIKKTETTQMPVAYMFRNEKGGGHACITDFYMVPLLHIEHRDSALNKRVIQLNHMHLQPRYVEWQSSFMANLGKLNEKFIEEGSYNFDGSMNQWKAIWRNMSYQFTTCTELRTFGQQPEEFWAFTNAILHEVDNELKVEYTNNLGVATHKGKNYYSPAFSEIFAHQRRDDDQYELDRFFIYKEVPESHRVDFGEWASMMDEVYKINQNGKWAILFSMLSCFRDHIFSHTRFFTSLFFIGPTGSGKSQVAYSIRSLFMSPDAPVFNLTQGTDAAFFMLLERNKNVISIMEEYNDTSISPVKFQGLKAAVLDGQGRTKIKDMNNKTLDSSKINAVPLILGQEAPQQDDGSLSNRVIVCDVPYNPNGEFTQEEKELFLKLKSHEKAGLQNVLVEVLQLRKVMKDHFVGIFNEEVKKINSTIRVSVTNNEGLDRVINSVGMVTAMCRLVETKTELKLPFTYDSFFDISCDKVLNQMEVISSSNKLSTYFNTISFLINQNSLKIGKDLKVEAPGKVTILKNGKTEPLELEPRETKVLYLDFEAIYPLYHRSNSKEALTRASLRSYFESNKAYIGLCKATNFRWNEEITVPREVIDQHTLEKTLMVDRIMKPQKNCTSAYMFNYEVLKELMGIDYERKEDEEEDKPLTPEGELPLTPKGEQEYVPKGVPF